MKTDFAYTFVVPAGNKISFYQQTNILDIPDYEYDDGLRYRNLNEESQKKLLEKMFLYQFDEKAVMFFEKHKDGRLHAHGVIRDITKTKMDACISRINTAFGRPRNYEKIFFVKQRPDIGWEKYMTKEQPQDGQRLPAVASSAPTSPEEEEDNKEISSQVIDAGDSPKDELIDKITAETFKQYDKTTKKSRAKPKK